MPFAIATRVLGLLSPDLPNKLLILGVVFVGGVGLSRFAANFLGLQRAAAIAGGTLFVINPFVYERLVSGQAYLAFAYATLPWALPSIVRMAFRGSARDALVAAAWTGVIGVIDVHLGGMALVVTLVALVICPRPWTLRLALSALVIAIFAALHVFWILPSAVAGEGARLGAGDLDAYAPRPRSAEILPRVLMLHGFWREEFTTPIRENPALFIAAFLPLVALAAYGLIHGLDVPRWKRPTAALGIVALMAIVLGMGTSFPLTAPLTEFLFRHLPGYGIYREPHKWIALLALTYSIFVAVGLHASMKHLRSSAARGLAAGVAVLPLIACPVMLWGFGGQIEVSTFPSDWDGAEQAMEGADGDLLFLPWNLYQPLPFAGNRTIANPGDHFFERTTLLSGDAALRGSNPSTTQPADPRDDYVWQLIRRGARLDRFGQLVAPLGVRFVALAHLSDAPEYGWLERQRDLGKIFEGDDLSLYENEAWEGSVYPLDDKQGDYGSIVEAIKEVDAHNPSAAELAVVSDQGPERLTTGPGVVKSLAFWKDVSLPAAPYVGTDKSCIDGWRLGTQRPVCHFGVMAAFDRPSSSAMLWRPGWFLQASGMLLSLGTAISLLWGIRRSRSGGRDD